MGIRVAQHAAELIDVNGILSHFHSGPSLAPAQVNLQSPLLPALAEKSDDDSQGRDKRYARQVRRRREPPTSLDKNPTCSRRVLFTAQLASIPLN